MEHTSATAFKVRAEEVESLLPDVAFEPGIWGDLFPPLSAISDLLGKNRAYDPGDMRRGLERLFWKLNEDDYPEALKTLKNIRRWALDGLRDDGLRSKLEGRLMAPDPSEQAEDGDGSASRRTRASRSVTARQARSVLANAFLGNCLDLMADSKDHWNAGGLDFRKMLRVPDHESHDRNTNRIGLAKMECLLAYFRSCASLEGTEDDERAITFDLVRFIPLSAESLGNPCGGAAEGYVGEGVALHAGTMESPPRETSAFVNFANSNYGYGKFISSCTQEEILFMCCPELVLGMLFIGKMGEDEVVNVRGLRRFCRYTGYLDSFECDGMIPVDEQRISTVLILDACYRNHFSEAMLQRDLGKAYHSFLDLVESAGGKGGRPVVSTGRWGCGVFGGVPAHKMLQQAAAAAAAGVDLEFSCFGSPDGCDAVLDALREMKPSAMEVVTILQNCGEHRRAFVEYVVRCLRENAVRRTEATHSASDQFCDII